MKQLVCVLVNLFLIITLSDVHGKIAHSNGRKGRWFGYTYTETKIQTEMVTSLVPSSCVHVEATLPPCRSVRNMQTFPEFVGTQIYPKNIKGRQLVIQSENPIGTNPKIVLAPVNTTKSVGWAEYLGLVAPTVTVTAIELQTTTILDPRTVVTFSVKGCRPSKLPLGLDRCPIGGITIEEILPSTTNNNVLAASSAVRNGKIANFNGNDANSKQSKRVELEPSSDGIEEGNLSLIKTDELSNVDMNN